MFLRNSKWSFLFTKGGLERADFIIEDIYLIQLLFSTNSTHSLWRTCQSPFMEVYYLHTCTFTPNTPRLGPLFSHSLTIGRNETRPSHDTLIFSTSYVNDFYLLLWWQNITSLADPTRLNCELILRCSKRMQQKVTRD